MKTLYQQLGEQNRLKNDCHFTTRGWAKNEVILPVLLMNERSR